MTFEFNNVTYRIGFRHDKSRRWSDHAKHVVALTREIVSGPIVLWCSDCHLKLSPLSRTEQIRNVHCSIWFQDGYASADKVSPTSFPGSRPNWALLGRGHGLLNVKAGDHYNREKGRIAALEAALKATGHPYGAGFRTAAWERFFQRKAHPVHA